METGKKHGFGVIDFSYFNFKFLRKSELKFRNLKNENAKSFGSFSNC